MSRQDSFAPWTVPSDRHFAWMGISFFVVAIAAAVWATLALDARGAAAVSTWDGVGGGRGPVSTKAAPTIAIGQPPVQVTIPTDSGPA